MIYVVWIVGDSPDIADWFFVFSRKGVAIAEAIRYADRDLDNQKDVVYITPKSRKQRHDYDPQKYVVVEGKPHHYHGS